MTGTAAHPTPRRQTLSLRFLVLLAIFFAGFVAFSAVTYRTVQQVKVNGEVYDSIIQGKDLIADILPPPAYIIESYLVSLQLTYETDRRVVQDLVDKSRALRREYETRHDHWSRVLPPGPLREALVVRAHHPAVQFFELRDQELLPVVAAGDRVKAAEVVTGRLRERYELHRRAVDEAVQLANTRHQSEEERARSSVRAGGFTLVALGAAVVLVVLVIGGVGWRFASELTRRIGIATAAATQVASGDLSVNVSGSEERNDETGQLLGAVGTMTRNLNSLVVRVKQSSIQLMSTANELGATSKQQEGTVQGFGASTSQIAAAVKEISATSQELLATMDAVSVVTNEASALAQDGRSGLEGMDATMRQLAVATASISGRLSVIREKASDINVVVTTITKVADQTNLLSINAAIEAEKAGEYGLGFLVLAREIRRLADQTAVSTLDIDRMVREMQTAVSSGVMEMDKFSEEVRRGVGSVAHIGVGLGSIIERVETLSTRFEAVNDGMRSQSLGASQIDQAMVQLMDGARRTSSSLKEFNSATEHLRSAVDVLREEIAHFRVAN